MIIVLRVFISVVLYQIAISNFFGAPVIVVLKYNLSDMAHSSSRTVKAIPYPIIMSEICMLVMLLFAEQHFDRR